MKKKPTRDQKISTATKAKAKIAEVPEKKLEQVSGGMRVALAQAQTI